MKKTALLITALFGASLANAHNVWLEPIKDVKGQYVVKFGHEETETYPQSKLKAVRLLDAKGQLQNATVNFKEGEAHFAAPDAAIAFIRFVMVFGRNCQAVNMSKKTKQQAPEAVLSVNPVKFGKAILHWDAQANKSHNMDYELIPTK